MGDPPTGEVLNQLLRSAHDSADGFRQGASLARNPAFKSLFERRAQERAGLILTLEAEVKSFGADPVSDGTLVGEANRLVTYARDAVARSSDKGLIAELVRREALATRNFEAVADDGLAPERARKIAAEALEKLTAQQHEREELSEQFR